MADESGGVSDPGTDTDTRLDLGVQVGCLGLTEDPAVLIAGPRTMYITSASVDLSDGQLAQRLALSGAVLQREAAIPGPPSNTYRRA